jgi:hypothetical protein
MIWCKCLVLLGGAALLLAATAVGAPDPDDPPAKAAGGQNDLPKILADRELWGKDFPTALGYLQGWEQAGVRKVAILPDQVVSGTPAKDQAEAQKEADKLTAVLGRLQPRFRPAMANVARTAPAGQPVPLRATVARMPEDNSMRPALTARGAQFLASDLTVAKVQQRLGAPQQITQEVVQTEKDERPAVLTLRHYANGAVAFVESDMAPRPGRVSRVVLDVPAVAREVFEPGG